MSGVSWGDVPTWVAGAFAAAAAYYARGTLKSQQNQIAEQQDFIAQQSANLLLERSELLALAEERRWAQARGVQLRGNLHTLDGRDAMRRWVASITNGSSQDLKTVQVLFGAQDPMDVTQISPARIAIPPLGIELAAPGSAFEFRSDALPEAAVDVWSPVAYFEDAAGRRWTLDLRGRLSDATDRPPPG